MIYFLILNLADILQKEANVHGRCTVKTQNPMKTAHLSNIFLKRFNLIMCDTDVLSI